MLGDRAPKDIEPMTKGKISRVGGIHSPVGFAAEKFLRRQHPAQDGIDVEFVPAGIEGRVGEHRDAVERDAVEHGPAGDVAPAAALVGVSFLVEEKGGAVLVVVDVRSDGLVGTDRGAHAAADAPFFNDGVLADAGEMPVLVAPFLAEDIKLRHAAAGNGSSEMAPTGQRRYTGRRACSGPPGAR
jgi:hypothetical protein